MYKKKKNFITGFVYGDIDIDYTFNEFLIVKSQDGEVSHTNRAKIKELLWDKIKKEAEEEIKKEIKDAEINIDKYFALTNAVITPDGKWHGMIPLNLLQLGFTNKETQKEYYSNYYSKFIKPYEADGTITIIKCNI